MVFSSFSSIEPFFDVCIVLQNRKKSEWKEMIYLTEKISTFWSSLKNPIPEKTFLPCFLSA